MPGEGGECWKSFNDGDSWSQISTNLPNYTSMYGYKIIEHENKLWLWGKNNSGSESAVVMWSTDGIEWNSSWYTSDYMQMDYASLIGLPNGRLWFYTGSSDSMYGPSFYYIGGPKKQDGLYYYQKD